jgi:hypothetical protein
LPAGPSDKAKIKSEDYLKKYLIIHFVRTKTTRLHYRRQLLNAVMLLSNINLDAACIYRCALRF